MSDELRKIAREYWDDLKAHVDEKELKRSDVWSSKHGPNVQSLIDQGLVWFHEDGSVTFSSKMSVLKLGPMLVEATMKDKALKKDASTKHGPNVQALVDEGIVRFESDGSAVFPAGKGGVEQLRKFFDALERDQELDKK